MLHIINKSPLDTPALDSCLRMAQPGSAILFIEDGVYAATRGHSAQDKVLGACAKFKVYALQPDLEARGVAPRLLEGVGTVDYAGFVDLTLAYPTSHTWL